MAMECCHVPGARSRSSFNSGLLNSAISARRAREAVPNARSSGAMAR